MAKGDFIEYVVSDDSNKYPNDGEYDGYYYAAIEDVTTDKVSVSDIIDNLTTNVSNKPLSAAQGVKLKALIDAITVPTKVSELQNDAGYITQHQDISGKANVSDLTAHTGNSDIHVTAAEKVAWNKNALPSVSPSDSGKILMVNSSGVPAWTTITNAEGVSY